MRNYFLKLEFFGGILTDLKTQEVWELNIDTAFYMFIYKYIKNKKVTNIVLKEVLKKEILQLSSQVEQLKMSKRIHTILRVIDMFVVWQ